MFKNMDALDNIPTVTLQQLRLTLGDDMSQRKIGLKMGIQQANVARIERVIDNTSLKTLRRFVEACDGELEIIANMNGNRFKIAL